jgi:hypothetical protein
LGDYACQLGGRWVDKILALFCRTVTLPVGLVGVGCPNDNRGQSEGVATTLTNNREDAGLVATRAHTFAAGCQAEEVWLADMTNLIVRHAEKLARYKGDCCQEPHRRFVYFSREVAVHPRLWRSSCAQRESLDSRCRLILRRPASTMQYGGNRQSSSYGPCLA